MRTQVKELIEKMSGNRVWLEPPTPLADIESFLEMVHPVAIEQPLIRVGSSGDGGYLLPDDLVGISACVSPGVSNEVGFDLDMANRGIDVYMVDGSVVAPPVTNSRFHFQKKFLDVFEDEQNLRLDSLVGGIASKQSSGDSILQMDIEGAEYRVLLDASDETMSSFRIMAIEFHSLTRLFSKFPFGLIVATFKKLLRTHYIVHIHPNNVCRPTVRGHVSIPPVMEFTFYRKDRAKLVKGKKMQFPNPLDRDNVMGLRPIVLPACWSYHRISD